MNKSLVIDNFFGDPDLVRQIALNAAYYTKDNHPGNIGHFPGHRTDYFNEWNQDLYQAMLGAQIQCAEQLLGHKLGDKFKEYWTKFSFSWTDKDVVLQEHRDFTDHWNGFTNFYGGVLYLTPNPPKNTGTILTGVETVENKYNRYVMYDATQLHCVEDSFGDTLENGRLVLTHFIFLK